MAATRYQILYRYINPNTGKPITNDQTQEYEETFEFYTDVHKIKLGSDDQKLAEELKKEQIVSDGNSATNPKTDMLFVYGGTKKIFHEKFLGLNADGSDKYKTESRVTTTEKLWVEGYPYVVKDYYIRVPMSPWMRGSVYGSLQAAVEKCRQMADAIGLDNIKLIKLVPYKQKTEII